MWSAQGSGERYSPGGPMLSHRSELAGSCFCSEQSDRHSFNLQLIPAMTLLSPFPPKNLSYPFHGLCSR